MAIFSSSKKNKKDNSNASPPLGSSAGGGGGPAGAFPRNASFGSREGASHAGQQHYAQRPQENGNRPTDFASGLGSSTGPGGSLSSSLNSTSAGPTGHNPPLAVLYPWAQRRLQLLPTAVLSPITANDASAAAQTTVAGPLSPPPFPRYGHSVNPVASAVSGELYIFGGLVQNAVKNDLHVLNCLGVAGAQSSATPALSVGLVETRGEVPGPRVGHASVGVGNVLVVWGGDTKSRPEDLQDDGLYLLNLSTKEWTRVKTIGRSPEGRYGHAAVMVGSRFFIFGGQKDDGGFMNDLVSFDLQKLKAGSPQWSFIEYASGSVVPPRRTGHTAITHGDCIYVFGGTDGQYHYNDTWCFDTNTGAWSELSCIGYIPVPREGHAATLVDDVMYVFGGRGVDGKDLEDLAAFKISNRRWFMFQNMGPAPSGRSGHAMATFQNEVLVLGGESYTSQRADDPAFVHVLDTSKIKYPVDSSRQLQQSTSRKVSTPTSGEGHRSGVDNQHPPATVEPRAFDQEKRAASPNVSQPNGNTSIGAFGHSQASSLVNAPPALDDPRALNTPKSAKRATTTAIGHVAPARPTRPDDDLANRRTMDPSTVPSRYTDRAMSPTGSLQSRPRNMSPVTAATSSAPGLRPLNGNTPPASSTAAFSPAGRAQPNGARSPSPSQQGAYDASVSKDRGTLSGGPVPPDDAFYYGSRPAPGASIDGTKAKDGELDTLKARERWLTSALNVAAQRGYILPADDIRDLEHARDAMSEKPDHVLDALVALKRELASIKTEMTDQADNLEKQLLDADGARVSALQEASYYRAKIAALESGASHDFDKVERNRALDLEKRLADATAERITLERRAEVAESDRDRYRQLHVDVEERHAAACDRADAAETSYARALSDYAELQRRAHGHESTVYEHAERLATLDSSTSRLTSENGRLKQDLEAAEASVGRHVRTLAELQLALTAAHSKNDELSALWDRSQTDLAEQRAQVQRLQSDLDAKTNESNTVAARVTDLETVLKKTRDAHQTAQVLATGGLAELLAMNQQSQTRSLSGEDDARGTELRIIEKEAGTFKQMHAEVAANARIAAAQLQDARTREARLQSKVVEMRSEIARLAGQQTAAAEQLARHRDDLVARDRDISDHLRAKETLSARVILLRSILTENGLDALDGNDATRELPKNGSETPEQLQRRVEDLEARLQQQTRTLETASRRIGPVDSSSSDLARQRDDSAEELEALRSRHAQLEATHLKAVQYVKGTEKMLRRMKEELTKYKDRCEELERPDRAIPPEKAAELEALRKQVAELGASQQRSVDERAELERHISAVQAEQERTRSAADAQLLELRGDVKRLDQQLAKAHHDLEETLAVNASLNQELTAALKSPSSPRGKKGSDDVGRMEAELTQAQNKAEWLRRENSELETRARTAESKLLVLLDHLESAGSDQNDTSADYDARP